MRANKTRYIVKQNLSYQWFNIGNSVHFNILYKSEKQNNCNISNSKLRKYHINGLIAIDSIKREPSGV